MSNAVDHKSITERNLMNPCLENISSSCCGNIVNDCCSFKGESCWFLDKPPETEQLILAMCLVLLSTYKLITWTPGEITAVGNQNNISLTCN